MAERDRFRGCRDNRSRAGGSEARAAAAPGARRGRPHVRERDRLAERHPGAPRAAPDGGRARSASPGPPSFFKHQASAGQQSETGWEGRESFAAPDVAHDRYREANAEEMSLANLRVADVVNTVDKTIGTVSEVVLGPDTSARFVGVDFGRPRGDGGDVRTYADAAREELANGPRPQSQ
jgi:hypothetical protein